MSVMPEIITPDLEEDLSAYVIHFLVHNNKYSQLDRSSVT